MSGQDHVDQILEQWRRERPDLDLSAMAVIGRISRASRILEQGIEAVLARHGINESQFGVLAALRRAGPPHRLTPTALYNSLLISSGAMTNRLDRLTEAGLVSRTPDPNDRRSVLVALTPKGRRVVDEAVTAHTENEHRLLASISGRQRQVLADLLRELLISLEDGERSPEAGAGRPRDASRPAVTRRSTRHPRAGGGR